MTEVRASRSQFAAPPSTRQAWWPWAALVSHVLFVAGWLLAATWQGPRYSVLEHTISDMYADGAPGAAFLIVVITVSGVVAIGFTVRSLWPALRPAGRPAAVGCGLLALSIFGLGDLLTPFERMGCRLADAGCTEELQSATFGGGLDAFLSTVGVAFLVAAGFFLTSAMKRLPAWQHAVKPTRVLAVSLLVLYVATGLLGAVGLGGLFERLLAAVGAAGVVLLAATVLRHGRRES